MTAARFCAGCGTPADGNSAFCTQCGSALDGASAGASAFAAPAATVQVAAPRAASGGSATAVATNGTGAPPIRLNEVPTESVGRACPYCRFPLKASAGVDECSSCHAMHHSDCWSENGGCAVNGCRTGAPTDVLGAPTAVLQTPAQGAAAAPGAPTAVPAPQFASNSTAPTDPQTLFQPAVAQPPSPPFSGKQPTADGGAPRRGAARAVLLTVAIMLALGGSGAALFIALSKQDDGSGQSEQASADAPPRSGSGGSHPGPAPGPSPKPHKPTGSGTQTGTGGSGTPPVTPSGGSLPNVSRSQMESDITDLIREHHEAIVNGDFQTAWSLLSSRKQSQYEREGGFSEWQGNQESLASHLGPAGAVATIDDLDEATGVARISVAGMTWSKSGATCSEWSGITWAKYEGGEWKYDPGYSTTPERRSIWKPRFGELLGGSCGGV